VHLLGDAVPIDYRVTPDGPMVRMTLRAGQVRRLREEMLPTFDRPLLLAVRRGEQLLEAATVDRLRELLDALVKHEPRRPGRGGDGDHRGGRSGSGSRGGRGPGRRGRPPRGRGPRRGR
jgi:hypothetical protein